jgi:hypothetical protein
VAAVLAPVERLTDSELREWIVLRRVCWETIVHREVEPEGGVTPIGYDVMLYAQCLGPGPRDPGGDEAVEALERLKQLADAVIPCDSEEDVAIGPFEPAFQLRAQADWEPEVRLVIEIRHDHEYFAAIDDDERACVKRVERALERWGAEPNAWPVTRKTRL